MEKTVFSEREKLFLVQLITDEKEIIENKRTDGTNLKLKNEAWERITSVFNSQGFSQRSAKQLKKCWENIKQRKRKLNTTIRQDQLMTGGGPSLKVPDDPVMDFVDAAAPNLDLELSCSWDSTAVYEAKETIPETSCPSTATQKLPKLDPVSAGTSESLTPCMKKRNLDKFLELDKCDERSLKVQKIKESVTQQRELHKQRMKTAQMEYLLSVLKVKQQLTEMGMELNTEEIDWDNFHPNDLL